MECPEHVYLAWLLPGCFPNHAIYSLTAESGVTTGRKRNAASSFEMLVGSHNARASSTLPFRRLFGKQLDRALAMVQRTSGKDNNVRPRGMKSLGHQKRRHSGCSTKFFREEKSWFVALHHGHIGPKLPLQNP
jgi:hypothetical protein